MFGILHIINRLAGSEIVGLKLKNTREGTSLLMVPYHIKESDLEGFEILMNNLEIELISKSYAPRELTAHAVTSPVHAFACVC